MQKSVRMRAISALLCIVMLLAAISTALVAHAEEPAATIPLNATSEGLVFTPVDGGYEITDFVGSAKDVLIPNLHEGLPVTALSAKAFVRSGFASENGSIQLPGDWFGSSTAVMVRTVRIESKTVVIEDSPNTIPIGVVIYGYEGSTAQAYAEKYGREFVALSGFRSAYVTLGSDITVYYKVRLAEDQQGAVVRFTVNGRQTIVSPVATAVANEYLYPFEGITPQMMGQVICAELLLGDTVIAKKESYSVREYCLSMLDKVENKSLAGYTDEQYAALSTLIADLLEYGATTQTFVGYHTDEMVNEGITGQSTFVAIPDSFALKKPAASTAPDGSRLIGAFAKLNNLIHLNFVFCTSDPEAVTIKLGDLTYTSEDFVSYADASVYGLPAYIVTAPASYATTLETVYKVALYVDGVQCQTLDYGVVTYLHSKQNDADANLKALVRAIRNYGLSALAYRDFSALTVVQNGTSDYRIVYSASASEEVVSAVNEMISAIKLTTGAQLTAVTDATPNDGMAKELLIGATNRNFSANVISDLKASQYAIAVDGAQIAVTGKTDETTAFAIRAFLRQFAGYSSAEAYTKQNVIRLLGDTYLVDEASISGHVALYVTDSNPSYVDDLTRALAPACDSLTVYSMGDSLEAVFDIDRTGLVIIAGADRMPAGMKNAVYDYMCEDGRVLTLGGPLFESELYEINGTWMNRGDYVKTFMQGLTKQTELEVSDTYLSGHSGTYSGSNPHHVYAQKAGTFYIQTSTVPNQSSISKQIYFHTDDLRAYNGLYFGNIHTKVNPNKTDVDAVCLWAKKEAGTATTSIVVSVTEMYDDADSSKKVTWCSVVELTEDWQYYVLPASQFEVLQDSNTPEEYKDPTGKSLNLTKASNVGVGFNPDAMSQKSGVANGYYVAGLSLADYNVPAIPEVQGANILIEGFAPMNELYPITNGASIAAHDNQVYVSDRDYTLPTDMFSCYAHREGMGYGNYRMRRMIPLLMVEDSKGLRSGYAAWINMFTSEAKDNGDLEGSMLGAFSISSEDFYDANGIAAVVETVEAMMGDTFLLEGGSDEFTYLAGVADQDTEVVVGATHITLRGADASNITTELSLYGGDDQDELLLSTTIESADHITLQDAIRTTSQAYALTEGTPTLAVVTLLKDGLVIDRIENDVYYWSPKPVEERSFVYTEDGYFKKDGEIINLYGVNFGPAYRTGLSAGGWWMGRSDYDPDVVANDLARVKDVGFNAVAVWAGYPSISQGNTVLDLLRQCEELGLYVDMGVSNCAYPLQAFNASQAQTCIQRLHIHENDTVISYDIAWEERIGTRDGKWWSWQGDDKKGDYVGTRNWEDDFIAWIDVQYGSLAHAQELWGVSLPIASDTNKPYVTEEMLDDTTGRYHAVTAAYYRFLDDIVVLEMQDELALLRDYAPNQLFSFRMSMSGSAYRTNYYKPATLCFDFQSLASLFDFMSPEGYILGTQGDEALQVAFANAYARYTKPDTPVVWKEFSASSWSGPDDSHFNPDMTILQNAADNVDSLLQQMYDAYTSGIFYWWTTPGYRRDEGGDCGAWNPDGSDRPVTTILRKWAPAFINQGEKPAAEVTIWVERDNQTGTIYGMFGAVADKLRDAVAAGKMIQFVDNNGSTGSSNVYADTVYDQAVAGTATTGSYPMRYVNGAIKSVTRTVKNGEEVLLITVCNTKQTTWRAGTVSVISIGSSAFAVDATIPVDVPYLGCAVVEVPIKAKGTLNLRLELTIGGNMTDDKPVQLPTDTFLPGAGSGSSGPVNVPFGPAYEYIIK